MDFRDPGLKTGVENDNYLVLNRVRVWRTDTPTMNSQDSYPTRDPMTKKKKQHQQQRQQHMKQI